MCLTLGAKGERCPELQPEPSRVKAAMGSAGDFLAVKEEGGATASGTTMLVRVAMAGSSELLTHQGWMKLQPGSTSLGCWQPPHPAATVAEGVAIAARAAC